MARREPKPTKALEVSVLFEPSHVAPAGVAQASERVVPITRRAAPTDQPHRRAGRERLTPRVGGAHACGRERRPPWRHESLLHDQPRRTPSRARWPPGGNAARGRGCTGPTRGRAVTQGTGERRWGVRRASLPLRCGGSMRGSGPASRWCSCTGRWGPPGRRVAAAGPGADGGVGARHEAGTPPARQAAGRAVRVPLPAQARR
jgi:hypothetical protein